MTNKKNTNYTNSDDDRFFDFLWACGKLALIVYVLYRITVVLGITP
jgi:hypothetical protein